MTPLMASSSNNKVSIEFTQQEVDLLSDYLSDPGIAEDIYEDEEAHGEIFFNAIQRICERATPREPETMLVPECIFPPGFADHLISMGLARRATPEEVREEFDKYEQGRIG